jgi:hypothetical protein
LSLPGALTLAIGLLMATPAAVGGLWAIDRIAGRIA